MEGTVDESYQALIEFINTSGRTVITRNSEVKRVISQSIIYEGTPLISVRKTAWKSALREMEWFLSGSNNINDLHPSVRHWWEPWKNDKNLIENNYSVQFRNFHGRYGAVDQIQLLIDGIDQHPYSRRNIITTWNTSDMVHSSTPITNCHGTLIIAYVENNALYLEMDQRSVDVICGMPHNLIQYWALLIWLAYRTGYKVGSFIWNGKDIHIYDKHYELANKILQVKTKDIETPNLIYTPTSEDFKADDFSLDREYKPILIDRAEMLV